MGRATLGVIETFVLFVCGRQLASGGKRENVVLRKPIKSRERER